MNFCRDGSCSLKTLLTAIVPATVVGSSCNNMVTAQAIAITLSSVGAVYVIEAISVNLTQENVDFSVNKVYPIKTTITITKSPSTVTYPGNPGYIMGKPVKLDNAGVSQNFQIADSTGNCLTTPTTSTPPTSTVSLLFGQNAVYSCTANNPCSNSFYIDQLIKL